MDVNHQEHKKWSGFEDKTLWDMLNLFGTLAIPLILGIATLLFGIQQAHLADLQHQSDQMIANQQHEADQQRALDQQQATILQTYIDNIQDLMLNHNLLQSKRGDDVATLARARTLTALQGLDPKRKGQLVLFIYEARLIGFLDNGKTHALAITLHGANLSGADLSGALLLNAILSGANFSGTHFSCALLNDTYLNTNLSEVNLSGASLYSADLSCADLSNANLPGADLFAADLSGTNLQGARYNTKPMKGIDAQGNPLTLKPTLWPQGFDPKAAGAICVDC